MGIRRGMPTGRDQNELIPLPPTGSEAAGIRPRRQPGDGGSASAQVPATWHRSLAEAIRNPDELIELLNLPDEFRGPARDAATAFPLLVPRSYVDRMQPGVADDPLLLQVLPLAAEAEVVPGFSTDAVADLAARQAPGLLQKYPGRALLITTGACAVHCRYCFRRHYPYGNEPKRLEEWEPAVAAIAEDKSLHEVILSGGDPLMLTDTRLADLFAHLDAVPHITRIRLHTRLPIVLPDRIVPQLLNLLRGLRSTPIVVVHANHPAEVVGDCAAALRLLVQSGITVLNQSVLMRKINDSPGVLAELSERLVNLGVMPYYLHQLDRVAGASHFEVAVETGLTLIRHLRAHLPGYAVPQYVQEIAGEGSKTPLL